MPFPTSCWALFPQDDPNSRYLAAAVPLIITAKFAAVGLGVLRDDLTVAMLARGGKISEILYGPLHYGVVFVVATLWLWDRPLAAVAPLANLCVGDAMAAIVGRHYGAHKWSRATNKSVEGSAAFVVCSAAAACAAVVVATGRLSRASAAAIWALAALGGLVEGLSPRDWDNLLVFGLCAPLSALYDWDR